MSLLAAEVKSTQARQEASEAATRESLMGLQQQLDALKAEREKKPSRAKPQKSVSFRARAGPFKRVKPHQGRTRRAAM
eukprot:11901658-Alexandrium_andersonii.AAC.1